MCWFKYRENIFFKIIFKKFLKLLSSELCVNVGEAAFLSGSILQSAYNFRILFFLVFLMLLKLHSLSMTRRLPSAGVNTTIPMQKLELKGHYWQVIIHREKKKESQERNSVQLFGCST